MIALQYVKGRKKKCVMFACCGNRNVTVMVGIHWDDLQEAGIKTVVENSRQLVSMIIERIAGMEAP
jgi:hypothetical protein